MAEHPPNDGQPGGPAPDPSMDDILASIRRILDEEGNRTGAPPAGPGTTPAQPDIPCRCGGAGVCPCDGKE